uniref:SusC/RagA family TonB-linked outer membrane protein n=1 Tax=Candidatus Cryptobacteroides bacterium TaxID=3085639 RepID=UPI003FF09B9A
MNRLAYIFLLFCTLQFTATAQSMRFSGRVTDTDGAPVIGAGLVCIEKNTAGTTTDLDGNFSITLPTGAKTVKFSSVGMKELVYQLIPGRTENVRIIMEWENTELDQVVVTGYAQTSVKRITGSVAVLNSEKFEAKAISSVDALMQGEVAGVSIKSLSGQPGTQAKITIRGSNNITGSSAPLWVVDGVPLQSESPVLSSEQLATGGFDNIFVNGIGNINPNDIESITILKDAAAAAIYGSRAANGVIVVTTKKGEAGKMRISYNNTFSWSFKPERSLNLMNSSEKLSWENELWNEFSAAKYAASLTDNTVIYPVVGIVGQIRAGLGDFASMKGDKAAQDKYIESLRNVDTNWYNLLFRNSFSQGHHLSLSGGSGKSTYYVALGLNDEDGMLIHNDYRRYNVNAKMTLTPTDWARIDVGMEAARQESKMPYSTVDPFYYAFFSNPYERAYNADGSYAADNTWFTLGYYNGRGAEQVLPKNGFNIIRELDSNYSKTANTNGTFRAQTDFRIIEPLHFVGLVSYSYSNNSTDKVIDKYSYSAFRDRLGSDDRSQTNLYGNISQNRTNRNSYVARGHFSFNKTFAETHTVNLLAGAELRGSGSNTIFTKRYNYDPKTGTTSLPQISGPQDEWLSEVEKLNGEYFSKTRYASFYASADYYLGKSIVLNASFRTDGSSNFGSNKQFNPTWSAGAAWHIGEEAWMKKALPALSHATLRAAYGFTGDVN